MPKKTNKLGAASTLLTDEKLLSWYKAKGCTLNCEINLDILFKKAKE